MNLKIQSTMVFAAVLALLLTSCASDHSPPRQDAEVRREGDAGNGDAVTFDAQGSDAGGSDAAPAGEDGGSARDAIVTQAGAIEPAEGSAKSAHLVLHGGLRATAVTSASARYQMTGRVEPVVSQRKR